MILVTIIKANESLTLNIKYYYYSVHLKILKIPSPKMKIYKLPNNNGFE